MAQTSDHQPQHPTQPGQQPATPPHEAAHADPARAPQTIQTSHAPDAQQKPRSVEERLAAIEATMQRLVPLIGSTEPAQPQSAAAPHNPTGGQR